MKPSLFLTLLLVLLCTNCLGQTHKIALEAYNEKANKIWQDFVPESGQAAFVQGELLRAIEKLRDEAQRNGNINFHKKCHGILLQFLRNTLSDSKVFDKKEIKQINNYLDQLSIENQPNTNDAIYDEISKRIVDWNVYYGDTIKHQKNTRLKC